MRIIEALERNGDPDLQKRSERLDGCCAFPQLAHDSTGKPVLVMQPCRDRMCPRCQAGRSRACRLKIASHVQTWDQCRFLTLTLKHRNASLREELKRLAEAFRKLRRSQIWKSHVRGGVYGLEATFNTQHGTWHAHMHILFDGEFFPHRQIKAAWKAATGDSDIVHIEAVNSRHEAATYVAKYVTKPSEVDGWPLKIITEFADAMHGKRMIHTFGNSHGATVEAEEEPKNTAGLQPIGSLSRLADKADAGDEQARHATEILCRLGPRFAEAAGLLPLMSNTSLPPVEPWELEILYEAVRGCTYCQHDPGRPHDDEDQTETPRDTQTAPLSREWLEPSRSYR